MATVRFSSVLKNDIIVRARGSMNIPVDRAVATKPDDNKWAMYIYNTIYGSVLPTLDKLPPKWFKERSTIEVTKIGVTSYDIAFQLDKAVKWPQEFYETDHAKPSGSYYNAGLILKEHPDWAELKAELDAYQGRIKAATDRRDEFVEMVRKVIEAYATLAPALKAWPALWDLLDETTKNKHREIKERVKNVVDLEDVDFTKLTAMSTAIKLSR